MTTPDPADHVLVPPRRQRLVRIVGARRAPRAAYVSIFVSIGAALLMLGYWRLWRADAAEDAPYQRMLEQVELHWKCTAGHRFLAAGYRGSIDCPQCGKPSDIIARFTCGKHDPVEVSIRLGPQWAPNLDDRYLRLGDGPFTPAADGLGCARCGQRLHYVGPDPLPAGRSKK